MATPDDLAEFNAAQQGFLAKRARWNDLTRGMQVEGPGANESARRLGIRPVSAGSELTAEGIMLAQHRAWAQLLREGGE